MLLYVVLAVIVGMVACFGFLDDAWGVRVPKGSQESVSTYRVLSIILVSVVFAVAWWLTAERAIEVGNDTANYVGLFLAFREGIQPESRYEIGFQIYCFLVGSFTDNPHVFLEVTASAMYLLLILYVFRYSENLPLSLCLAFCFAFSTFTNELRQSFALLICMYAYQQLGCGHRIRFCLLVCLAATFHLTALICLALLFYKMAPKKILTVYMLGGLIAIVCATGLFSSIIEPFLGDYYSRYLNNSYAASGWLATSFYLLRAGVLCLLVYICTKGNEQGNLSQGLARWNFVLLVLVSALGFSMNLFSRVAQYFLFVSISELPNMICESDMPHRKAICALIGIAFILFFLVVLWLRPEWNHLYPYQRWA